MLWKAFLKMDDAFLGSTPSYPLKGALREESTFLLMARLVKESRKYQRQTRRSWLGPVGAGRRERRKAETRLRLGSTQMELLKRYSGVLGQIWRGAEVRDDQFEPAFESGLTYLRDACLPLRDGRRVPTVLWQAVHETCNPDPELKGKFMLRPFVDELPDCQERGILRMLYATSFQLEARRSPFELLRASYPKLHAALRRRRTDISLLTDGAITPGDLREAAPSRDFYDRLFLAGG